MRNCCDLQWIPINDRGCFFFQGIHFVKTDSKQLAASYGIDEFPTLVYFEDGIPNIYEGIGDLRTPLPPPENNAQWKPPKDKAQLSALRTFTDLTKKIRKSIRFQRKFCCCDSTLTHFYKGKMIVLCFEQHQQVFNMNLAFENFDRWTTKCGQCLSAGALWRYYFSVNRNCVFSF